MTLSDYKYIGLKYDQNHPDIFVVYTNDYKIELYQIANDILNPVPLNQKTLSYQIDGIYYN